MPKLKTCAAAAAALAVCAMLQAPAAAPASLRAATASALDAFLHKAVDEGRVPAAVAVVASADRVLYLHAAGTRDVAAGAALEPDAIFRIASMTKPIVAVAALVLVEECRLRLDDPVDELLPELADRKVLVNGRGPLDVFRGFGSLRDFGSSRSLGSLGRSAHLRGLAATERQAPLAGLRGGGHQNESCNQNEFTHVGISP